MRPEDLDDDPLLARLLASVKADAEPALWTRVRARAEAKPAVTGLLAWAMRPAALAASFALLLGTAAVALTLGGSATGTVGEEYASLSEALLAERSAEATPAAAPAVPTGTAHPGHAAGDSGTQR